MPVGGVVHWFLPAFPAFSVVVQALLVIRGYVASIFSTNIRRRVFAANLAAFSFLCGAGSASCASWYAALYPSMACWRYRCGRLFSCSRIHLASSGLCIIG